jgi:anionic cell wall polymer biosynthesis LytR-Cps2A-Psr (LCP) family protein
MEYFIPIQFATLIDLVDKINEISVDIQEDILNYNLLSTSLDHKDTKKIVYHHLIKKLCISAVKHNFCDVFFVYSNHRLSFTKLNALFKNTPAEIKQFVEDLITICKTTLGLQIVEYNGGAKKLYEDYQSGYGSAISAISNITKTVVKNNKKNQLKFFKQCGLKNLFETHFKDANYLILTT